METLCTCTSENCQRYIFKRMGDVLDAQETYIAHQCNCVSRSSAGLAKSLFAKFPYAECYTSRKKASIPGTIIITKNIINMFAQYYPGKAVITKKDSSENRLMWFRMCLKAIEKTLGDDDKQQQQHITIAIPERIGCGLAGGDVNDYHEALGEFARDNYPIIRVILYKK